MKSGRCLLGLLLIVALSSDTVKSDSALFDNIDDQLQSASSNSLPLSSSSQPTQRRMSLEDFFFNRNNNNNNQQQEQQEAQQQQQQQQVIEQQVQRPQFQVQQPDPNSVLLLREAQFPSSNGGLLSRLLMARRMLRLRRWSRRLRLIPALLGMGLQQQASEPKPTVVLNSRVGRSIDDYDPREYIFNDKNYNYNNSSLRNRERTNEREYERPLKSDYSSDVKPYYDTVHDLPYDLYEHSSGKRAKNYETEDLASNHQSPTVNAVDTGSHAKVQSHASHNSRNIQQQLAYLRSQKPQLSHQENNRYTQSQVQTSPHSNSYSNQYHNHRQNDEAYTSNAHREIPQEIQYSTQKNNQHPVDSPRYEQPVKDEKYQQEPAAVDREQSNLQHRLQLLREQQYQLERERQLQMAREHQLRQLQQQLQQQERYNQEQQQQNYNQQQSYNEPLYNQNLQQQQPLTNHDQESVITNQQLYNYQQSFQQQRIQGENPTLNSGATRYDGGIRTLPVGSGVGVGVNVGLLPPSIDVSVTKPEIKPLPPIISPIPAKPVAVTPVHEQLVPLGFLPKPLLNLSGRLFFGAEMGKGVNIG